MREVWNQRTSQVPLLPDLRKTYGKYLVRRDPYVWRRGPGSGSHPSTLPVVEGPSGPGGSGLVPYAQVPVATLDGTESQTGTSVHPPSTGTKGPMKTRPGPRDPEGPGDPRGHRGT